MKPLPRFFVLDYLLNIAFVFSFRSFFVQLFSVFEDYFYKPYSSHVFSPSCVIFPQLLDICVSSSSNFLLGFFPLIDCFHQCPFRTNPYFYFSKCYRHSYLSNDFHHSNYFNFHEQKWMLETELIFNVLALQQFCQLDSQPIAPFFC